jgi:hypothetical protein
MEAGSLTSGWASSQWRRGWRAASPAAGPSSSGKARLTSALSAASR